MVAGDIATLDYILTALYGHKCDGLAQRLTERFGSLRGIFRATKAELVAFGLTDRIASFFCFIDPCYRRALLSEVRDLRIVSERDIVKLTAAYFSGIYTPTDCLFCLDRDGKVLRIERITDDPVAHIIGAVCRSNGVKAAWARLCPHAIEPSTDVKRLKQLSEVAQGLQAVGAGLIDYIEYTPYRFIALGRAMKFDRERGIDSASDEPYSSEAADILADYLAYRITRRRAQILRFGARNGAETEQNGEKSEVIC